VYSRSRRRFTKISIWGLLTLKRNVKVCAVDWSWNLGSRGSSVASSLGGGFREVGNGVAELADRVQADTEVSGLNVIPALIGQDRRQNIPAGEFDHNYFTSEGASLVYVFGTSSSSGNPSCDPAAATGQVRSTRPPTAPPSYRAWVNETAAQRRSP
jgi:hypothetical protein